VPALGVYAVRAGLEMPDGNRAWQPAVANLGRRPTFDKRDVLLEVHLIDFQGDLYGRRLWIEFVDYIRPEQKFSGLDALQAQIAADRDKAKEILSAL
jgi:riboflavin kinase/FMN adenylyltransferase